MPRPTVSHGDHAFPAGMASARPRRARSGWAGLGEIGQGGVGLGGVGQSRVDRAWSRCGERVPGGSAPDPAEAPIEVVVEKCDLNRESVAAGTHEVTVVGTGVVVVTGPGDGPQVLRLEGPTGQPGTWRSEPAGLLPGDLRDGCGTNRDSDRDRLISGPAQSSVASRQMTVPPRTRSTTGCPTSPRSARSSSSSPTRSSSAIPA